MPRRRQRTTATIAMILAGVVAFALVNPFCCHLLPYFEGEPAPGERTVDEAQSPCPGKPEAVLESPAAAPDFVAVMGDLPLPVIVPVQTFTAERVDVRRVSRAGPPRHVLFGVFLI